MIVDYLATGAALWGALMAVSPLLQIRRMAGRRSAADVSIAYLVVLQVGFGLWVAYGLALGNFFLVLPNSIAFVVGIATVLTAWHFRGPRPAA